MKQTIAVTGATGFIGRSICRRLLAEGHSLKLLIRGPRHARLDSFASAEIVQGDLDNTDSLAQLVSGADAVVHCAGRVRGATQVQFDRVNVDGTRNIIDAIRRGDSRSRLLLISSLAAREPQLSYYAMSKFRAEQLLVQSDGNIAWTILRPPAVYGPGDREMLPIFRLMARGMAFVPGSPEARFSLLYVDDLSSAVSAWLASKAAAGGTFGIDDGREAGYDWHEFSGVVGSICKRRVRLVRAHPWLLDVPAWVNSRIGAVFGTSPMLTPQKLRELRHPDWVSDNTDFERVTHWQPKMSLADGLLATPNWPGYKNDKAAAD